MRHTSPRSRAEPRERATAKTTLGRFRGDIIIYIYIYIYIYLYLTPDSRHTKHITRDRRCLGAAVVPAVGALHPPLPLERFSHCATAVFDLPFTSRHVRPQPAARASHAAVVDPRRSSSTAARGGAPHALRSVVNKRRSPGNIAAARLTSCASSAAASHTASACVMSHPCSASARSTSDDAAATTTTTRTPPPPPPPPPPPHAPPPISSWSGGGRRKPCLSPPTHACPSSSTALGSISAIRSATSSRRKPASFELSRCAAAAAADQTRHARRAGRAKSACGSARRSARVTGWRWNSHSGVTRKDAVTWHTSYCASEALACSARRRALSAPSAAAVRGDDVSGSRASAAWRASRDGYASLLRGQS